MRIILNSQRRGGEGTHAVMDISANMLSQQHAMHAIVCTPNISSTNQNTTYLLIIAEID